MFQFFHDHGNFLTYAVWNAFVAGHSLPLDTMLNTQWIPQGYIRNNAEKGGYHLTGMGADQLTRLNTLKEGDAHRPGD